MWMWMPSWLSQVEFPLAGWDLSQYVGADAGTQVYNCYAISNHLGNKLAKGHYTACVQMPVGTTEGSSWFLFSDESVKPMEAGPGKVRLEHTGQSAWQCLQAGRMLIEKVCTHSGNGGIILAVDVTACNISPS